MDQAVAVAVDVEAGHISRDMRDLYERAIENKVKREEADTLANIAGKNLKALSLILAHRMVENESLARINGATVIGRKALKVVKKQK